MKAGSSLPQAQGWPKELPSPAPPPQKKKLPQFATPCGVQGTLGGAAVLELEVNRVSPAEILTFPPSPEKFIPTPLPAVRPGQGICTKKRPVLDVPETWRPASVRGLSTYPPPPPRLQPVQRVPAGLWGAAAGWSVPEGRRPGVQIRPKWRCFLLGGGGWGGEPGPEVVERGERTAQYRGPPLSPVLPPSSLSLNFVSTVAHFPLPVP